MTQQHPKAPPSPNLQQKLDDIDNLLVDAVEHYHTPKRFFTYSGSAMQSIRTFTLAIQSNKDSIPNFAVWYKQWQDNMKHDPRMKWLHNKRNEVAHTDALSSDSYATIFTVSDYRHAKVERRFDCRTSNEELMVEAQLQIARHPGLAHTHIAVGRKYAVDVDGKSQELIELLAYGFNYLRLMYADLLYYLESGKLDTIPGDFSRIVEREGPDDDRYRFFTFKASDGQQLQMGGIRIKCDEVATKQFIKEYGKPRGRLTKTMPMKEAAEIVFSLAQQIIQHGDTFVPTVYMYNDEGYQPLMVASRDRAEKLKFAFDLPLLLDKHNAKGVMFVAEAWAGGQALLKRLNEGKSIEKMRKKEEYLWLTMLTKDLKTLDIIADIQRTDEGAQFGDTRISNPEPESLNFLRPVYIHWRTGSSRTSRNRG